MWHTWCSLQAVEGTLTANYDSRKLLLFLGKIGYSHGERGRAPARTAAWGRRGPARSVLWPLTKTQKQERYLTHSQVQDDFDFMSHKRAKQ